MKQQSSIGVLVAPRPSGKKQLNKKIIPYLFLVPAFIYYAVFWLWPVFSGMKEVFTDMDGKFTLLDNFKLMYNSDLFGKAIFNTATFAAVSVLVQYVIAMLLAVLLSRKFKSAKVLPSEFPTPMLLMWILLLLTP